jgi:hypothetical protein
MRQRGLLALAMAITCMVATLLIAADESATLEDTPEGDARIARILSTMPGSDAVQPDQAAKAPASAGPAPAAEPTAEEEAAMRQSLHFAKQTLAWANRDDDQETKKSEEWDAQASGDSWDSENAEHLTLVPDHHIQKAKDKKAKKLKQMADLLRQDTERGAEKAAQAAASNHEGEGAPAQAEVQPAKDDAAKSTASPANTIKQASHKQMPESPEDKVTQAKKGQQKAEAGNEDSDAHSRFLTVNVAPLPKGPPMVVPAKVAMKDDSKQTKVAEAGKPQKNRKKQQPKITNKTFKEIESLGDSHSSEDAESDDSDSDSTSTMSMQSFEDMLNNPDEADEVASESDRDGESISKFLRREAAALKEQGRSAPVAQAVLKREVAAQNAPSVVTHLKHLPEEPSDAAKLSIQAQVRAPISKKSVPAPHPAMSAEQANRARASLGLNPDSHAAAKSASRAHKSAVDVDTMIDSLGGYGG